MTLRNMPNSTTELSITVHPEADNTIVGLVGAMIEDYAKERDGELTPLYVEVKIVGKTS